MSAPIPHRCVCDVIDHIVVDGDYEAVFHERCEGFLGFTDEFPLHRAMIQTKGLEVAENSSGSDNEQPR